MPSYVVLMYETCAGHSCMRLSQGPEEEDSVVSLWGFTVGKAAQDARHPYL